MVIFTMAGSSACAPNAKHNLSEADCRSQKTTRACTVFAEPQEYSGLWSLGMETSDFFPETTSGYDWDASISLDIDGRSDAPAFMRGGMTPENWGIYRVKFIGRRALDQPFWDDDGYGHMGMSKNGILVEKVLSIARDEEGEKHFDAYLAR